MTAWTREVTRRLRVGIAQDPEMGDWPGVAGAGGWEAAIAALDAANDELLAAIRALNPAQLDDRIGDARDRALGQRRIALCDAARARAAPRVSRGTDRGAEEDRRLRLRS